MIDDNDDDDYTKHTKKTHLITLCVLMTNGDALTKDATA